MPPEIERSMDQFIKWDSNLEALLELNTPMNLKCQHNSFNSIDLQDVKTVAGNQAGPGTGELNFIKVLPQSVLPQANSGRGGKD